MNGNQGKPKRWNKNFRDKNDSAALLILVVISIIVTVSVISCDKNRSDYWAAYITTREQLQNAVALYASVHNGSLPTLNGTYTNANCSNCSVINISALLTANGGLLQHAPDGLNLSASSNDNCGGNASLGCRNGNSYIWIIATNNGSVYSYCAGAKCKTHNSGDQDVWP